MHRQVMGVIAGAAVAAVLAGASMAAQERPSGAVPGSQQRPAGARPAAPKRPTPRTADGHVLLGWTGDEKGVWERRGEHLVINPKSYQANATRNARIHIDQVPLQPWARALVDFRHSLALASEPYTRCKPSGGPRQFMSPYGLEIEEFPELKRVYIFNISNAQSYRTIYMDGREHPKDWKPDYFGHSVGHWEGDTLVVDTVGFDENFWMNRDGLPHTSQMHLVERVSRPDFDTLNYEVTIDDPGAYTGPWTSGYTLGWQKGLELFEYSCQENNLSPETMAGDNLLSLFVP